MWKRDKLTDTPVLKISTLNYMYMCIACNLYKRSHNINNNNLTWESDLTPKKKRRHGGQKKEERLNAILLLR